MVLELLLLRSIAYNQLLNLFRREKFFYINGQYVNDEDGGSGTDRIIMKHEKFYPYAWALCVIAFFVILKYKI
jgi:hypothetical protein